MMTIIFWSIFKFQHTAARRRLVVDGPVVDIVRRVSTHSRPKAAGRVIFGRTHLLKFQHTAARRRLGLGC